MTKVYISGPMTGLPGLNKAAFDAAAQRLKRLGFQVVNPHDLARPGLEWEEAMKVDIAALVKCDAILLLPGWENSRGAALEGIIARELGLTIY
jgi:hypothetical protein